ncbi:ATP-binding cassette domain-containing protein, partial [Bacillus haynesii]
MTERDRILQDVVNFIEENIRNSTKTEVNYIDLKNQKSRILTNQNHVIFGRRGAGKSSLLNVLIDGYNVKNGITLKLNMEDFKDITFPNIITHILIKMFQKFDFPVQKTKWFEFKKKRYLKKQRKKLKNTLTTMVKELKDMLQEPEVYTLTETNQNNHQTSGKTKSGIGYNKLKVSREKSTMNGKKTESTRTYEKDKLLNLRDKIVSYKDILNDYSNLYNFDYIFLVLDDFYFIPRDIQSKFIDYFHRLTKDTPLFLKVASIKFRTRLYEEDNGTYIGTEINHDIMPIELDYTLDDFKSTTQFMRNILNQINNKFNSHFINELFSGEGFNQLCLASGGVPRDFLSLITGLLNKIISKEISKINKVEVTKIAIEQISNKINSIKSDSADELNNLEITLHYIKNEVVVKRKRNTFFIGKDEMDNNPEEYGLIKQLMDLRLIHLVNSNTSSKNDGKRYEAYMV